MFQGRPALEPHPHERLEVLPVLRELEGRPVPARPLRVPELGLRLEASEDELARVRFS